MCRQYVSKTKKKRKHTLTCWSVSLVGFWWCPLCKFSVSNVSICCSIQCLTVADAFWYFCQSSTAFWYLMHNVCKLSAVSFQATQAPWTADSICSTISPLQVSTKGFADDFKSSMRFSRDCNSLDNPWNFFETKKRKQEKFVIGFTYKAFCFYSFLQQQQFRAR